MKKLIISGKEIRRIGYTTESSIREALKAVTAHFRRDQKSEAINLLSLILHNPGKYNQDPVWKHVATALSSPPANTPKAPVFLPKSLDFRVFGEELIDRETLQQMYLAMKLPVAVYGALMPDAHLGYGLPIGGVLAAYNAVIPYGVGMDIGCRMCLSVFPVPGKVIDSDRERLKKILISETRFGNASFNNVGDHELFERNKFLRGLKSVFIEQLGTSGHGNHFVDIGEFRLTQPDPYLPVEPGNYLAILSHSGSRNFGAELCRHYTKVAQEKLGLAGESGRLAWLDLDWEEGQEYWQAMQLAGDYSRANHRFLHERLSGALGYQPLLRLENHHNFAWKEKLPDGRELIIHRKGATPAGIGDIGIIPGTMASPAYIVAGRGNETSLNSAAHGAGRAISRNKAKQTFNEKEMKEYIQTQGVELIGGGTDEAPQAYKNIQQVMESQNDLVETLALFYPRIVKME
jgi:tRNA-splicing ligase RtcB (3'-phosphate/5'-hydroxy nucleic acid ligase)